MFTNAFQNSSFISLNVGILYTEHKLSDSCHVTVNSQDLLNDLFSPVNT